MAACLKVDRRPGKVVELGAGTGSITGALLAAGVAREDLILVERNPALCELVRRRYPGVKVACCDAQDLQAVLAQAAILNVRTIVSSLPLLAMDRQVCDAVVQAAFAVLADDGEYLQFTYGPAQPIPKDVREALRISGDRSRWVLANLPPAAVWRFRRAPASAARSASPPALVAMRTRATWGARKIKRVGALLALPFRTEP
jgi:phosphatidylethanolamine/phosphatidyl-N-methylethanolamine N-methyltransferase